ncbi:unnamed protein product [Periconia digitata]|uniref:GH18 domain-containing protein n=1 Tax=Periconia digitata TaxID=1303443 RepID=A0A9W4UVE9_9PLEO|nr:unnamed protein product [Periconia digitata]
MTIGIAAPASFWYLKGFPIEEMSSVVDYIVYMTYDLHGQWDYDNAWASDGCPTGNCLRHHSNRTETETALVMVTKAGVPANKVIVGMPIYGRSFKMTTPGCAGPDCKFVGKDSAAAPGRCTGTKGYISKFEIRELISSGRSVQQLQTKEGDEVLVYDETEWVGWMSKQKHEERSQWVKGLNFGGSVDWAIDLDANFDVGNGPGGGTSRPSDPEVTSQPSNPDPTTGLPEVTSRPSDPNEPDPTEGLPGDPDVTSRPNDPGEPDPTEGLPDEPEPTPGPGDPNDEPDPTPGFPEEEPEPTPGFPEEEGPEPTRGLQRRNLDSTYRPSNPENTQKPAPSRSTPTPITTRFSPRQTN